MYAAFSWQISSNSLNSGRIKELVKKALADRKRQIILPTFMTVQMSSEEDYDALCLALEDAASEHLGEFHYVCLQCTSRTSFRPLLDSRPGWNGGVTLGLSTSNP